jgi:hypothetical protein
MSVSSLTQDYLADVVLHAVETRVKTLSVCDAANVKLYSLPESRPLSQSVLEVSPLGVATFVDVGAVNQSGVSGSRPSSPSVAQQYFDTTLGYPIWWNGAAWVTASGSAPSPPP